jgi:hypothetical protein
MRLFDLENSAQTELVDTDLKTTDEDVPMFDKSRFGGGMKAEDDIKW